MSQTVLNSQERSASFWKFLFFFVLSTAFIVGAIYFNSEVPHTENKILHKEVARYKLQEAAQAKFVTNMDDAKRLIDSLSTPGANVGYLNQQINAKINELANLQYKDSSIYNRLNKSVIDVFLRYQDATNKAIGLGNTPQQLEDYKQKYEQTQRDLDNCRRDFEVLRRSANSAQ